MRRLVSNSEVQTFKQCRRKWYLSWIQNLAPKVEKLSGVRSTGTRLHVALETKYQPGVSVPDSAVMAALVTAQDADQRLFQGTPEELKALLAAFQLEQIMLEGYLEWLAETGADAHLEVIASEQYVEAVLPAVEPPVVAIGKLDVQVRDLRTGRKSFIDHKSVATFEVPMLTQNQQILHYELLSFLSSEEGENYCDAAMYNMMRRVKRTSKAVPPFYKRVEVRHNQHELRAYQNHLVGVVTDMQRVEQTITEDPETVPLVIYPTPHRDCAWKCEFLKICRLFDDGSRVDAAISSLYRTVDPLEYYQGKERREDELS
jgi:hypothetical protein